MELWNNNEDFRKHYIESNKNSTLRRLRTLDGRSLGPDEEPPILQTNLYNKLSLASPLVVSKSSAPTVVSEEKAVISATREDSFPALQAGKASQPAKSNKTAKSAVNEAVAVTVSERGEAEDAEVEKARKKEEQERARKEQEREEEIRREMAAAEKERCRLEQKVKAKEAEERKKRLAQRAQARAESRAVKEADLKDKVIVLLRHAMLIELQFTLHISTDINLFSFLYRYLSVRSVET